MTDMIGQVTTALLKEDPTVMGLMTGAELRELAVAAIKAMREPSDEMLVAMSEAEKGTVRGPQISRWKAAIDAALEK